MKPYIVYRYRLGRALGATNRHRRPRQGGMCHSVRGAVGGAPGVAGGGREFPRGRWRAASGRPAAHVLDKQIGRKYNDRTNPILTVPYFPYATTGLKHRQSATSARVVAVNSIRRDDAAGGGRPVLDVLTSVGVPCRRDPCAGRWSEGAVDGCGRSATSLRMVGRGGAAVPANPPRVIGSPEAVGSASVRLPVRRGAQRTQHLLSSAQSVDVERRPRTDGLPLPSDRRAEVAGARMEGGVIS